MTDTTRVRASEDSARASSIELVAILETFERMSSSLVLLDPYSLDDVARTVMEFRQSVEDHLEGCGRSSETLDDSSGSLPPHRQEESSDYAKFAVSLEELNALLEIVRSDDHGGNRQALGQYGKILAEAWRHHLRRANPGIDLSSVQR